MTIESEIRRQWQLSCKMRDASHMTLMSLTYTVKAASSAMRGLGTASELVDPY